MTQKAMAVFVCLIALLVGAPADANDIDANGNDHRPHDWCGWWMRQNLHVTDAAGNKADWWANYGTDAQGPAVGVLVVWPHHVGIITGQTKTGWIVKSGNDDNAVRERERSLRGVIAFRRPFTMSLAP